MFTDLDEKGLVTEGVNHTYREIYHANEFLGKSITKELAMNRDACKLAIHVPEP